MHSENIVFLASHPKVFALGAIALHDTHGVVDIIGRDADRRLVRWYETTPLPLPDDDPDCLLNETIAELETWVPVSDLQDVAPRLDVDRAMLKAYYDDRRARQSQLAQDKVRNTAGMGRRAPMTPTRDLTLVPVSLRKAT